MNHKKINPAVASIPVFLTFFCMGFGDVAGTITDFVEDEYKLGFLLAALVPSAGFIMFGLLPVPFSLIMARRGKKLILSIGLAVAALGLIIPTVLGFSSFGILLISILMLGAGAALLQVAGNPIMRDVSPEGKYSRNLSFGQFVKAIGTLSASVGILLAAKYFDLDWKVLFPIYSIVLIFTLFILAITKINEEGIKEELPTFRSCFKLLGNNKTIALMVLGIFVYVGAEVSVISKLNGYMQTNFGVKLEELGVASIGLFVLFLTLGRFLGGVILNWINAQKFLKITSIISLIGIIGLFFEIESISLISVILIGLGFANIFPLIFSITVDKFPEKVNELSGLMITAVVGGAILPIFTGLIAEKINTTMSFVIPALAIIYVLFIAFRKVKKA